MPSPTAVILELRAQPGQIDEVRRWFADNLGDTRAWEGCESVEFYNDASDADAAVVLEHWRSRDEHEAYSAWRAESGTLATLVPLLAGAPAVRYVEWAQT